MYGAPFGKKYTFCEPCFLSLNKLKKHGSQNVYFFPNGEFVRYISRKYPTCFACVFWSDLEHNLSDIQYKSDISDVYIGLIIVQISSKNRVHKIVFSKKRRLEKNDFVRLILRVYFGPS